MATLRDSVLVLLAALVGAAGGTIAVSKADPGRAPGASPDGLNGGSAPLLASRTEQLLNGMSTLQSQVEELRVETKRLSELLGSTLTSQPSGSSGLGDALKTLEEAISSSRSLAVPDGVRISKRQQEVDAVGVKMQKDRALGIAQVFCLTPAQLYQELGSPDNTQLAPDGNHWYYLLSDRRTLDILLLDGVVSQAWVREM